LKIFASEIPKKNNLDPRLCDQYRTM